MNTNICEDASQSVGFIAADFKVQVLTILQNTCHHSETPFWGHWIDGAKSCTCKKLIPLHAGSISPSSKVDIGSKNSSSAWGENGIISWAGPHSSEYSRQTITGLASENKVFTCVLGRSGPGLETEAADPGESPSHFEFPHVVFWVLLESSKWFRFSLYCVLCCRVSSLHKPTYMNLYFRFVTLDKWRDYI